MLDLHVHVLPGIDDGPRSVDDAMALLQGLVDDGVTHAVATPHIYAGVFDNHWASISTAFNQFADELDKRQLPITLSFAAEVRLCPDMVDWLVAGDLPVMTGLTGQHAVLVELPDGVVPIGAEALLAQILSLGVTPIIAHPERNRAIMEQPGKALALARLGCKLQVTAGSLLGEFGERAQLTAVRLLGEGAVYVVASDAHNMRSRMPRLGAAQAWLRQHYGDDLAVALTSTHPMAMAGRGAQAVRGPNGLVLREMPLHFRPAGAKGLTSVSLQDLKAPAAAASPPGPPEFGQPGHAAVPAARLGEWRLPALKTWDQPVLAPAGISDIAFADTVPMAHEDRPRDRWTEAPATGTDTTAAAAAAVAAPESVTVWAPDATAVDSLAGPLPDSIPVLDRVVAPRASAVIVPFVPAAVLYAHQGPVPHDRVVMPPHEAPTVSPIAPKTGNPSQLDPVTGRRAW